MVGPRRSLGISLEERRDTVPNDEDCAEIAPEMKMSKTAVLLRSERAQISRELAQVRVFEQCYCRDATQMLQVV